MPPRPHHRQSHAPAAETLSRVAPLVTRWVERLLASHEPSLTVGQYLALHAVDHDQLVGIELARRAGVSPAAISQVLSSLEDAGLLERARSDTDRRRQQLSLTTIGTEVLESIKRDLRTGLGGLLTDLPPHQTEALAHTLENLEAVLTGVAPPRRPPHPRPPKPHPGP
jgi:DNA-binding MarR family transcriptional regulator